MSSFVFAALLWVLVGSLSGFLLGWVCGRIWRGVDGRMRMATRRGVVVLGVSE